MFTVDMPDVPQHYASAVIASANQAQKASANKERSMGVCFGVNYNQPGQPYAYSAALSPEYAAAEYFGLYEKQTVGAPPSSNVELVEPPKHGKLDYSKYEDGSVHHGYIPDPGYVGDERIVFKVNVDGKTVKLVYLLKVTKVLTGGQVSDDVFCKKTGTQWKISSAADIRGNESAKDSLASIGLTSWLRANELHNYMVDFALADLPGTAGNL